ncbi:MAG: hypothetical protein V5A72_01380, partial [Candidatus Nanohaloarchaea archaeon]
YLLYLIRQIKPNFLAVDSLQLIDLRLAFWMIRDILTGIECALTATPSLVLLLLTLFHYFINFPQGIVYAYNIDYSDTTSF